MKRVGQVEERKAGKGRGGLYQVGPERAAPVGAGWLCVAKERPVSFHHAKAAGSLGVGMPSAGQGPGWA